MSGAAAEAQLAEDGSGVLAEIFACGEGAEVGLIVHVQLDARVAEEAGVGTAASGLFQMFVQAAGTEVRGEQIGGSAQQSVCAAGAARRHEHRPGRQRTGSEHGFNVRGADERDVNGQAEERGDAAGGANAGSGIHGAAFGMLHGFGEALPAAGAGGSEHGGIGRDDENGYTRAHASDGGKNVLEHRSRQARARLQRHRAGEATLRLREVFYGDEDGHQVKTLGARRGDSAEQGKHTAGQPLLVGVGSHHGGEQGGAHSPFDDVRTKGRVGGIDHQD